MMQNHSNQQSVTIKAWIAENTKAILPTYNSERIDYKVNIYSSFSNESTKI